MPLVKIISRLCATLPLAWALALGRFLGWVWGSVVRHRRSYAISALQTSFPEKSKSEIKRIVNRMYANLGMNIIETLRLPHASAAYFEDKIEIVGRVNVERARQRGRGVLMLCAHLDNWELVSIVSPRYLDTRASVVVKKIKSRIGADLMLWIRQRYGLNLFGAKRSYREILRTLKNNEVIGFVIDQNMIGREGEFVEFFGRPACTTLGLAHLAAQSGAPIVPVIPVRKSHGRHIVKFLDPIDPPASKDRAELLRATQGYTRIIEDAIRENPDQWLWIHRRWKTQPKLADESP